VLELRGVTAKNVLGALREMDCMGSGAASVRPLYHAAINTAPDERLTDEQKRQAADRLEKELGLEGQPRLMVEHVKKDREHLHVVFLRIDTDRMVAIPDSHNYRKHEIVARDLERAFGHRHVQGAHVDREDKERPNRTPGHDEMQQAERTGLTPQEAKEQVTRLWHQSDSGKAFAASVRAEGWVLAKGDKRDFVLVDQAGETHSLARRVDGANAAQIRQRMSDVDPAKLPTVTEAKALQRDAVAGRSKETEKSKEPDKAPIILKVPVPIGADPAKPLQLAKQPPKRATATSDAVAAGRSPEKPTEPKPPKQKLAPTSSKLKKLYTAAASMTQRAYGKAKGVFGKKQPAKGHERPQRPHAPAQPSQKPVPGWASTKQAPPHASKPVPKPPAPAAAKKKLTREEVDEMIGRQRDRRRERGGPSR
jgi:hypothetical protein